MRLLGTITVPNAASRNNDTGGATFTIPKGARGLYIVSDVAARYTSMPRVASPSALAATTTDFLLAAGIGFGEALPDWGADTIVAVRNDSGGAATVRVYVVGA